MKKEDEKILKSIKYYLEQKTELINQFNNPNSFTFSTIISKAEQLKEVDLKLHAMQIALNN